MRGEGEWMGVGTDSDFPVLEGYVVLEVGVSSVTLRADPFDGFVHVVWADVECGRGALTCMRYPAELVSPVASSSHDLVPRSEAEALADSIVPVAGYATVGRSFQAAADALADYRSRYPRVT